MSEITLEQLNTEAHQLRTELEAGLCEPGDILRAMQRYYEPSSLQEVDIHVISKIITGFPQRCCDAATALLGVRLGGGLIVPGLYENNRHSYLLVGDVMADITADQFNGPPVYIGPLAEPWSVQVDRDFISQ
jgi:hypothetical protein